MAHLRDLIGDGETVTITDSAGNEYKIFVTRPSSLQQDEARAHANGKMAKSKLEALEKRGDKYIALKFSFAEITDHDELVRMRMQYEEGDMRDMAFNEVLYKTDEDGEPNKWQKDDFYLQTLTSATRRMADIHKYNDEMRDAGSSDRIIEAEDEELLALNKVIAEFRAEVDELVQAKLDEERENHEGKTNEELQEELLNLAMDLESKMAWYQDFQLRMLYYACRYDEDKKKFYFDSAEDVAEIPDYVRSQLYDAYERIERGTTDIKNLLSPPSS